MYGFIVIELGKQSLVYGDGGDFNLKYVYC